MKYSIVLLFSLIFATTHQAFAQTQDGNPENFLLMISLKYKETPAIQITLSDSGSKREARLSFRGTKCQPHELGQGLNISDTYHYQQLRAYLTEIDLATFQPSSEDNAPLQIKMIYMNQSLNTNNEMHFGYNPDNFSELNVFFEHLLETMDNNITRSCTRDFYEKVKGYLTGE